MKHGWTGSVRSVAQHYHLVVLFIQELWKAAPPPLLLLLFGSDVCELLCVGSVMQHRIYFILWWFFSLSFSPRPCWPTNVLMEVGGKCSFFFLRGGRRRNAFLMDLTSALLCWFVFCLFVFWVCLFWQTLKRMLMDGSRQGSARGSHRIWQRH